jgi:hypothetical protein
MTPEEVKKESIPTAQPRAERKLGSAGRAANNFNKHESYMTQL